MHTNSAILYSFRRCPYAMRARLAIAIAGVTVELREVALRNKPKQLLDISAKATVPVLQLNDHTIIDESLDIMLWALTQNDPGHWLDNNVSADMNRLIQNNDQRFKYYLDRYKYADRYPEHSELYYRNNAEFFIMDLENRLSQHQYLCSDALSLADMAIFPFIRQFANVNSHWFHSSIYTHLRHWLQQHIESELFISIMDKYPTWQESNSKRLLFPHRNY